MSIKSVEFEKHKCSRINSNVIIRQNYVELKGAIKTPGHRSCQSAANCIGTDCIYAGNEFGKDYLK